MGKIWPYNAICQRLTSNHILMPHLGPLTNDALEILRQADEVYQRFEQAGLDRYYKMLEAKAREAGRPWSSAT